MGDIVKRKGRDGKPRYYVRYFDADGVRRMKASKQTTKADARIFLATVEERVRKMIAVRKDANRLVGGDSDPGHAPVRSKQAHASFLNWPHGQCIYCRVRESHTRAQHDRSVKENTDQKIVAEVLGLAEPKVETISRGEAIAHVLEASDGHLGRAYDGRVYAEIRTRPWAKDLDRYIRLRSKSRSGTLWTKGSYVVAYWTCENCGQSYKEHGASREEAKQLGIDLQRRSLICPVNINAQDLKGDRR